MGYNLDIHHRRSIRPKGYDYSTPGACFVTICTQNRKCLFGEIVGGMMWLNEAGLVARQCWSDIPGHFPHVELDGFVVMRNHIHGIVIAEGRARHAVPLRNDSGNRWPALFQRLCDHINPP
jgi:putative transposase